MKYYKRLLCGCLCLACLFATFSVTAKAEEIEVKPYHIYINASLEAYEDGQQNSEQINIYPNDGQISAVAIEDDYFCDEVTDVFGGLYVEYHLHIANDDGSVMFEGGKKTSFSLDNAYIRTYVYDAQSIDEGQYVTGFGAGTYTRLLLFYADGSKEYVTATYDVNGINTRIYCEEFYPEQDVVKVEIIGATERLPELSYADYWGYTVYIGEWDGDDKYQICIDQQSEEAGILAGIGDTISGLWDTVTDGFDNLWSSVTDGFSEMGNKLTDLWNAITELPQKIWQYIEDGLKSLFIPDEEYMAAYKDRWEDLLADRLGAVWQVVDVTFGAWEDITLADEKNTLNMPEVSIPLPDGQNFTFGGYEVKIVPDGFGFLVDALKLIVGISCTVLFVNGIRKRYDEIMGVEQ